MIEVDLRGIGGSYGVSGRVGLCQRAHLGAEGFGLGVEDLSKWRIFLGRCGAGEDGGEEQFLEVGEGEAFGLLGGPGLIGFGELEAIRESAAPLRDEGQTFGEAREGEVIFAVEPAGTFDDGGVELFGVVGGCHDDDAGVGGEAVEFVEE